MTQRLFIGATLSEGKIRLLHEAQAFLKEHSSKADLTKVENLHLTLRFIGDVSVDKSLRIQKMCSEFSIQHKERYQTQIQGLDCFSRKDGLLVYADLKVSKQMFDLVSKFDNILIKAGIKPENRQWLPHITIARRVIIGQHGNSLPHVRMIDSLEPIPSIHLFLSEFTNFGMRYTPIVDIM